MPHTTINGATWRRLGQAVNVLAVCLYFAPSTNAQTAGCPCVTNQGLPTDGNGQISFTDPQGGVHMYPGDYGEGECKKWDELLPPYCAEFVTVEEEFQARAAAPAWCELSWCYVDPTNCDQLDVTKTFIFEAEIKRAEKELYYSYSTCGSTEDTFAKWSRSGSLEAVDLVQVVEDYLLSEIKPLSEKTLAELVELSSSDCDDGWVDSCSCNTCAQGTGEWGNNQIDIGSTSVTVAERVDLQSQELRCLAKIVGRKYRNIVKSEYDDPSRVANLYFARQSDGGYFQWPAIDWCPDNWDPRFRPWYASAVSGPKEVVLVIDKSGSMSGAKMNNANEAAATVLDTLTEFDFASVVFFDSDIASSGGLRQATQSNVAELKRFITGFGIPDGGTDFQKGFQTAFDLLRSGDGNHCQKIILFLTDGEDTSRLELSEFRGEGWNRDRDVTVFSYIIGGDSSLVEKPARIACQNGGKFFIITDVSQIKDTMADYFRFFAVPPGEDNDIVRWVDYEDDISGARLVAGCLAIYKGAEVFGTACMDVNVISKLADLESKPTYPQFQAEFTAKSKICRPVSHSEAELELLRGESRCDNIPASSTPGRIVGTRGGFGSGLGILRAVLAVAGTIVPLLFARLDGL